MADPRKLPKIIAVANQKGGVGKTTTAINLGAALARRDRRVLLVDLDPQGNASTGLGLAPEARKVSSFDLLLGEATPEEAAHPTANPNLLLVPATSDLSGADLELGNRQGRTGLLRGALRQPLMDALRLDYILIDCPPSLNVLTINALVAAQSVLVPLQSEFFALEGLSQLMLTIREVRQTANPSLRIEGVALTMVDRRTSLAQMVEADARENLGDLVFQTVIPRNVRLSEAPSHAQSVLDYDPSSAGANAYRALAAELLARES
ncbi:ParA family protein [Rubellimicrobium aerolatum]|uniref:ParA family protein n=1 Tax=Rubellimicrobium aerolatum TaxID=490979 RepID=A0ABW0SA72_9RHOB|nr:AAA family ATPase [Rubellimicrobium aerolatum]MBP1805154.1 chromosome partitioning protein [Rubellimicrobium aerolatum]